MYIRVNATPGAKKEKITRVSEERFDIAVKEPAERNLANERIKELLMLEFGLKKGDIRLISGHRSPHKIFSIMDHFDTK